MNESNDCNEIEREPEVDYLSLEPQTRFIKYIQRGRTEEALDLIEQGLIQADVQDRKGFHLLHYAAIAGSVEILEALLKLNAKLKERINISDWTGCTPLHYTCNEGWEDCTEFLLKNGASTKTITEDSVAYIGGTTMPVYAAGGKTPLHLAAERGETGCVKILLQYGASIHAEDFDGNLPYHLALLRKSTELAQLLKPTPQSPTQLSQAEIDEKKLSDHRKRSQRITQKEKERKEKDRQAIISKYDAMHPEIFSFEDSMLVNSFSEAVKTGDKAVLLSKLKEEAPGVYSFDLLTPDFCKKLIEEQENYEKSGLPVKRPNSMNNYGLILDDIGFQSMITEMIKKCVTPLAKYLFPDYGGANLDSHHAFIVRYKIGEDLDLSTHTDDSEVTLNVCLGKDFTGGTLYFDGVKHTDSAYKDRKEYTHTPGKAVLHIGKHIHGANKITGGERINLIIWCRSSQVRGSKNRDTRPPDIIIPAEPGKHKATVIFLHGLGDNGESWVLHMRKLRIKHPELRFVIPTARTMPISVNDGKISTAWHDAKGYRNISDETFEGLEDSKQLVEQIIEREVSQTGIPHEKIFLAGFSQGGATALYVTYTSQNKLCGCVSFSGYLPFDKEFEKRISEKNKNTEALLFHGLADQIIKAEHAKEAQKTLEKLGVKSTLILLQDHGHRTNDTEFKKMEEFIVELLHVQ